MAKRWVVAAVVGVVLVATGFLVFRPDRAPLRRALTFADIVPAPASAVPAAGSFTVTEGASIVTDPGSVEVARVGEYLAALLGHATTVRPGTAAPRGGIALVLQPQALGDEDYQLDIGTDAVTIRGHTAAGLFWGVQTLRQLMPGDATGPIVIPGGRIVDRPRFAYRGVMLDVARHFFDVTAVKRFIDLSTMYKVNYLHLHLTDDQGWRIAVDGWPRLATYGGATAVGGGPGGFYTRDDYREIVAYAAQRFVTVVPEVDLPGHTNAALSSYPELNCDHQSPQRYTGIAVGFSALCANADTYRFLDGVLGELAALTPGPYLHIGGDEAQSLAPADYATIVSRAQAVVSAHGKAAVGWHELASTKLTDSTVLQFWDTGTDAPAVVAAAAAGHRVIMSPANRAYLDQKYDGRTKIGLSWAGPTSVERAYDWDPAGWIAGLDQRAVLGVEAALWTETVTTVDDIEYLAFPRLAAIAEIGWSPASTHSWPAFRTRLGAQAPRWTALGVDFAQTDDVPWLVGDSTVASTPRN